MNTHVLALVLGCAALFVSGCAQIPPTKSPTPEAVTIAAPALQEVRNASRVMGTELIITALGPDKALLEKAVAAAVAEINRVEDLMTDWRPSPLETLNAAAGQGPQKVPVELARLIARSLKIGELSQGSFDISYAGVGQLWNFKQTTSIPSQAAIDKALRNVGYQRLQVRTPNLVTLPKDMRIGLGGIAKGYGVDRAMSVLRKYGVEHAIVNAGGDMKVLGKNFGEPWEIAIKHPRDRERALAVLRLANSCVVTSGDYERFFEIDGIRYHHIIDPRNGQPARGAISATVIAPEAAFADALATACCILGPKIALPIIESLPRVEALLITADGNIHTTANLATLLPKTLSQ